MHEHQQKTSSESSEGKFKIGIASDHGGYCLKQAVFSHLLEQEIYMEDYGCFAPESVDYPDYAKSLAKGIKRGEIHMGILICGTGIGMSISANKIAGIRAALCNDSYSAEMARRHNDANVLTMGERVIGEGLAKKIALTFIQSEFDGGRHQRRVNKMMGLEK